jgi:ABC-2 type transport system ATP-binding protein
MIIQTDNLTKRFGGHDAVSGLQLAVPEGATYALIGANGAGKTTTLRMLVNLLRPDSGSAQVLGIDSRALSHNDFQRIGYVSESQEVPLGLKLEDFFIYLRALYRDWDTALERVLRRQFELPPALALGKLSHGMRMKVKLVAALAFRPKLLILDEPLSGLDALVRDEILAGLLGQADETTIVISSHELAEIEGCTTHVAFLAKGRLLLQESIESLTARFREVRVITVPGAAPIRALQGWLGLETSGALVRFVDSAFVDEQQLRSKLNEQAGTIHHFEAAPMSLRDISKALIRTTRVQAAA